mmetsp:Transcript_35688/g.79372  ORF Transcript_35688/g.79372 Transcript_35688/m.79372 type:complete len:230 (+) Transcript_35688:603-1292(+)
MSRSSCPSWSKACALTRTAPSSPPSWAWPTAATCLRTSSSGRCRRRRSRRRRRLTPRSRGPAGSPPRTTGCGRCQGSCGSVCWAACPLRAASTGRPSPLTSTRSPPYRAFSRSMTETSARTALPRSWPSLGPAETTCMCPPTQTAGSSTTSTTPEPPCRVLPRSQSWWLSRWSSCPAPSPHPGHRRKARPPPLAHPARRASWRASSRSGTTCGRTCWPCRSSRSCGMHL